MCTSKSANAHALARTFENHRFFGKEDIGAEQKTWNDLHKSRGTDHHQVSSFRNIASKTTTIVLTNKINKSVQLKSNLFFEIFSQVTSIPKENKMVHIENLTNVDIQETVVVKPVSGSTSGSTSGPGFPIKPILNCYHSPPAELDPYIYVVLTSL